MTTKMFDIKTYGALVQDMTTWILANQDAITDFNEGSISRSITEATARVMARLYMKCLAGFENYNIQIPSRAFGVNQKSGQAASGEVTFSIDSATGSDITIASGVLLQSVDGDLYETTEDGTITAGNTDSDAVSVQAQETGSEYNLQAGELTLILDSTEADSVTNASYITGGQNQESNEAYLQRFQEYTLGLSKANVTGQISVAADIDGVNSASLVEHFPPAAGYYNTTIYIEDGGGVAPQTLVDTVQLAIDGNNNTIAGTRGSGTRCRVLSSTVLSTNVTIELLGVPGIDLSIIEYLATSSITGYMNNLDIGETFRVNELINRIMDNTAEIQDVNSLSPSANIVPSSNQVVRLGTLNISVVYD